MHSYPTTNLKTTYTDREDTTTCQIQLVIDAPELYFGKFFSSASPEMKSDASDRIEQVPVIVNMFPTANRIDFSSSRWNVAMLRDPSIFDAVISHFFYEVTIYDMEALVTPPKPALSLEIECCS
ncbi:hypothetical protein TWF106_004833 [Orbilia oligospora]|uniref:Uncharacterized protein n=1 Tax=Orbilia oligospora TaxID=2813651 RepID=A0A7C8QHE2_ORBOL|nr:hypothetical protein TWF106_004833 [Orbilia oligospora]KAF3211269.1 hypothetical protein TWF679_006438 [Orbilia oligospora]KAF3213362.1 hypothetical protein TWF191_010120 [Orbilia oligospora]